MYSEKTKTQVVYANMCKYLTRRKSKRNLPADRYVLLDRTWKLVDFFFTSEFKNLLPQESVVDMSLFCSFFLTVSFTAGSKSNPSFGSHTFQGQVFQKMDTM